MNQRPSREARLVRDLARRLLTEWSRQSWARCWFEGPLAIAGAALVLALGSPSAFAHCDTVGGPVVAAAQRALDSGDIAPILKWVKPAGEPEIRAAFSKALAVRAKGPEARELADTYFFENLVRIHRAGEGAAYTGLKPSETWNRWWLCPTRRSRAARSRHWPTPSAAGGGWIRHRFARALAAKKHAEESVAAGREFVEAYVELTHYVERLDRDATTKRHRRQATPACGARALSGMPWRNDSRSGWPLP